MLCPDAQLFAAHPPPTKRYDCNLRDNAWVLLPSFNVNGYKYCLCILSMLEGKLEVGMGVFCRKIPS